jgi:cytidylate kinase
MITLGSFEKAKRYIEAQTKAEEKDIKKGAVITISRQTGAGSDLISNYLTKKLNKIQKKEYPEWMTFDKNLIAKVLKDHDLPVYLSKLMEEKKFPGFTSVISELFTGQPGHWNLVRKTSETILQLSEIGSIIVIGRGSNIITAKLNNAFHIRLIANLEDRIAHAAEVYNLNKDEVLDFIKDDDKGRKDYLYTYFQKDIDDPLNYHLVINTSLIPHKEAADLIADYVTKKFNWIFKQA